MWFKRHGPSQSCHFLSNYNTSNNSAFSHSQLQITPLCCRLLVSSLPSVLEGDTCSCVYMCVDP